MIENFIQHYVRRITKMLSNKNCFLSNKPVRNERAELLTTEMERWKQHFQEVLNPQRLTEEMEVFVI